MAGKYYWIKERHNPQTGTYFVAMGNISQAEARRHEGSRLYGANIMHRFATKEAYEGEIARLKAKGERVHNHGLEAKGE